MKIPSIMFRMQDFRILGLHGLLLRKMAMIHRNDKLQHATQILPGVLILIQAHLRVQKGQRKDQVGVSSPANYHIACVIVSASNILIFIPCDGICSCSYRHRHSKSNGKRAQEVFRRTIGACITRVFHARDLYLLDMFQRVLVSINDHMSLCAGALLRLLPHAPSDFPSCMASRHFSTRESIWGLGELHHLYLCAFGKLWQCDQVACSLAQMHCPWLRIVDSQTHSKLPVLSSHVLVGFAFKTSVYRRTDTQKSKHLAWASASLPPTIVSITSSFS